MFAAATSGGGGGAVEVADVVFDGQMTMVGSAESTVPINVCERKSSGLQPRTTALTD